MDIDKIGLIAQEIMFAFEDNYNDVGKRQQFAELFKYLLKVDPTDTLQHYEALVMLGRSHPDAFNEMVEKMKEASLITG